MDNKIQFHATFAHAASDAFGKDVLDVINLFSDYADYNAGTHGGHAHFDIGGVIIEPFSCDANLYPVNYTASSTLYPTLTPTTSVILPPSGMTYARIENISEL